MRPSTILAAATILGLTAVAGAQTVAGRADIVRPCTGSAPSESLFPLLPAGGAPATWHCDENDFVAIEMEDNTPASGWVFENESRRSGFSGRGYLRWAAQNYWSSPGNGVMTYRVFIDNPGTYQIRIYNRHDNADPSLENDCWIRVNGSSWIKAYSNNGRNQRVWNWHFRFDPGHGPVQYTMNRGINEIQISGRSTHFMLDRMHVFRSSFQGENLNLPLSEALRRRPVIGADFDIRVGDPNFESGLTPGQTSVALLQSVTPASSTNCGTTIPGLGVNGAGELLLGGSIFPYAPVRTWNGPSQPTFVRTRVPNDRSLVGATLWVQGVLFDTAGRRAVLTDGMKVRVGDF